MCAGARARFKVRKAILRLAVMGVLLAIAATGCGDAGPGAPDDQPVATTTPAGSVKPVNTVSSADGGPAAPDDLPVAALTPAGSAKPVHTASTGDGIWVLDLVDGLPVIEETVVTLRIIGNGLDGYDGCNRYGGVFEDETPVAGADGVFSRPPFARTEKGCFFIDHANPNVIMDQADVYISALVQGERYRVAGDRLEILDGEGATRLVFVREAPLPGQPVDLRGTSWRLITDDDVDNDERVTTLIFNGRQVTGSTACRDYLASYEMSEGSVRFPSKSALGSVESCSELDRRRSGEFTSFLSWAWEYSVHEEQGISRLRIRSSRGKTLTFEPLP